MRSVKDLMSTSLHWLEPAATARAAAAAMTRHRVGSLLVGQGTVAAGIVSEIDLVRRVLAQDRDPSRVTVAQIMCGPVVAMTGRGSIEQAGELMAEHEVRHVVVTAGRRVVGMLSVRDLLPVVSLVPVTVERMMTRLPVLVPTVETVRNAAALMAHAGVSAALVSGARLRPRGASVRGFSRADIAGIVTGTDLVRGVMDQDLDPYVTPVSAAMSSALQTIEKTEPLTAAFDTMARGGLRHLGVTSGGDEVIGLLSIEDVLEPAWLHAAAVAKPRRRSTRPAAKPRPSRKPTTRRSRPPRS